MRNRVDDFTKMWKLLRSNIENVFIQTSIVVTEITQSVVCPIYMPGILGSNPGTEIELSYDLLD